MWLSIVSSPAAECHVIIVFDLDRSLVRRGLNLLLVIVGSSYLACLSSRMISRRVWIAAPFVFQLARAGWPYLSALSNKNHNRVNHHAHAAALSLSLSLFSPASLEWNGLFKYWRDFFSSSPTLLFLLSGIANAANEVGHLKKQLSGQITETRVFAFSFLLRKPNLAVSRTVGRRVSEWVSYLVGFADWLIATSTLPRHEAKKALKIVGGGGGGGTPHSFERVEKEKKFLQGLRILGFGHLEFLASNGKTLFEWGEQRICHSNYFGGAKVMLRARIPPFLLLEGRRCKTMPLIFSAGHNTVTRFQEL